MKLYQPKMFVRSVFNLAAAALCIGMIIHIWPTMNVSEPWFAIVMFLTFVLGALGNLLFGMTGVFLSFSPPPVPVKKTCMCSSTYCSERPAEWPQ